MLALHERNQNTKSRAADKSVRASYAYGLRDILIIAFSTNPGKSW